MKARFCDHYRTIKHRARRWLDTAGIEWVEDECSSCGRIWRHR